MSLGLFPNLVNVSLLEALEEEEVELAVLRSSLLGRLLDEVDELLFGHVLGVASQVVLNNGLDPNVEDLVYKT